MAYDLEEQEKVEAIKAWWNDWGNTVILAVALFVATVAGAQGWRWYQRSQAEQAAALYMEVERALAGGDDKKVRAAAAQVVEKFGRTAYAPRAALLAGRSAYEAGDVAAAKTQLAWTADNAKEDELRDLARLRLAGILLDEKKYDEALKAVESARSAAYGPLFSDMKGDVLAAQGKKVEARSAYQSALEKLDARSQYRGYIQLKLDVLGG
ncbi:MAG TPA: tetratricopeptide repeat protein [Burkholderiales bacterium]|nr:tetratricopeptide repeat protein [Burkholderiales bacterium]